MKRREFLRLGGAGCVALAAAGSAQARELLGASSARVTYRRDWTEPGVDAARLVRGDPAIARHGTRLTVFGLAPDHRAFQGRAALEVLFPRDGWHARFCSWSRVDPVVFGEPSTVSFVLPVDPQGHVTIEPSWNGLGFPVTLTSSDETTLPKLRSGFYLFTAANAPAIVAAVSPADHLDPTLPPWRNDHAC